METKLNIRERIINTILDKGLVDKGRLESVLGNDAKADTGNLIRKIAESDILPERELLMLISRELGIPLIDISRINLNAEIMNLLPEKLLRGRVIAPVSKIGNNLTLAVSDPTDVLAIDDVKTVTGCEIVLVLAAREELKKTLQTFYDAGGEEEVASIFSEEEEGESDVEVVERTGSLDISEITKKSSTAPIVKIVGLVISEAIKRRASDIHIEPEEKSLAVRYRIDGVLHKAFDLPKKNQNAVLARLKIMSNLDITENRVPQDGRFRIKLEGKEIDFRVSVLPITFGNKIVMRALDKSNLSLGLESLGFLPRPLEDFKTALAKPFGIILVTGPTGSGKSTTLYSVLNEINVPERNIVTVEDPVEYQVQGLTQIATHAEIGLDFAKGLRAILRQSPDVIMVGEIRDFETADVAIKASLTGQMVLSTLHTNDAVGAITRLMNMGIDPFLIASSLILTSAQRLLRKICPHCKVEADISKEAIEDLRKKYPEVAEVDKFYVGKGCPKCGNTGYRGRLGTLETVPIDDHLREMIYRRKSEDSIKEYLKTTGFKTLRENAITKFCKGWTTLEEVFRVT